MTIEDNIGTVLGQRVLDADADNCGEVVDALSLAVALAINPNVSLQANVTDAASGIESPSESLAHGLPEPVMQPSATVAAVAAPGRLVNAPAALRAPNLAGNRAHYQYELTLRGIGAAGLLPGISGGANVAGAFGRNGTRLTLSLTYLPVARTTIAPGKVWMKGK